MDRISRGHNDDIDVQISQKLLDQFQYLGNCPPTLPLTQQQSIDNKLR